MFAACTVLLMLYGLNRRQALELSAELAARRANIGNA